MLALQVRKPFQKISDETVPAVQRVLDREQTGGARRRLHRDSRRSCARSTRSRSTRCNKGELIALPVLFLMLLLVFRSPVAALVPSLSGLLVTRSGSR